MSRTEDRNDSVTLMLVPGRTGQIRRFQLARASLRRFAMGAGVLCLAFLGLTVDYVRVRVQVSELGELRRASASQQEALRAYSERMAEIAKGLEQVAQLDRKLRVITNLDPADAVPLVGIGGVDDALLHEDSLIGLSDKRRAEQLTRVFEQLTEATQSQSASLSELVAHLEDQTTRLSATPSIAPSKGWVTSKFGYRTSPFTGGRELHRGVDIAGRMGTPIIASADGVVVFAGNQRALGLAVAMRHGYGVETRYGHLSQVLVEPGEHVKRGQKIALMGSSGRSTGPHLHYQVEVSGEPVNPQNYILD